MAKIELKGTIVAVNPVEVVGKKDFRKQAVILNVAAYTDSFGDKKGRDEDWCLEVLGDNIEKLNLNSTFVGMKAICTVFVNSSKVEDLAGSAPRTFFIINAVLNKVEFKA